MANRLKSTLSKAIEVNQCAFVKGCILLENILLVTEFVKDYHKDQRLSIYALKVDIAKAFDSVQGTFICKNLKAMNFPLCFIHWIFLCISTGTFSITVNGEMEGFFPSQRGFRQGCSLLPYLYVLVNNVLSKKLNEAAILGNIGYHPFCDTLHITHLSFADDMLVFTDGRELSIKGVLDVFAEFSCVSGLAINTQKTSVFNSGTNRGGLVEYSKKLGLIVEDLPIRYLGLPLTTKIMTRLDCEPLVDRIHSKLLGRSTLSIFFWWQAPVITIRYRKFNLLLEVGIQTPQSMFQRN